MTRLHNYLRLLVAIFDLLTGAIAALALVAQLCGGPTIYPWFIEYLLASALIERGIRNLKSAVGTIA